MKRSLLLAAALPFVFAAIPAHAQSIDGCVRLPSASRVIVIPKEGCGTAVVGQQSGDNRPVVIYGVNPAPAQVVETPVSQKTVINHNIAIVVTGGRRSGF